MCHQSIIGEYECFCKGGRNLHWCTQGVWFNNDQHSLACYNRCPRVILLHDVASWGNLNWSSCLNEGKAGTLRRCPWNFDIWQLRWMLSHEPIVQRCGTIVYNMKLQMLVLRREVFLNNKTKCQLSALISSRSLDNWNVVESQINDLYLTSWCRHHNTVLGSKSCIRRTQCRQDAFWWYGFLSAYSCTL